MNIRDKETRSLVIVILLTIGMQLFSLIRNSIAASNFGVSTEMDAYNVGFNITTFLFSFFGSAVTTVLIPSIAGEKRFSSSVRSFITYLFLLSLLVSFLGIVFSKSIIALIAGNQSQYFINLSAKLLSILLLGGILTFILGVNAAVFQVRNRFTMLKITQLVSYVYIVMMLALFPSGNIYFYAEVITTANIVNLVLQIYYLKKDHITFKFNFLIKDNELTHMFKSLLPVFMSTGLYQFSLIINTALASRLKDEGQVSLLSYANQVVGMVNTLILANIILFIYPKMAIAIKKSITSAKEKLLDYMLLAFFIMTLIVLLFIVAGKEGIAILYERGAFTSKTTDIVYSLVFLLIVVLPLNAMRDLFYKFFYADNDTFTPFRNSIVVSAVNIVFSLTLSLYLGLKGIILGASLSTIISLMMITRKFEKCYGKIFNVRFIKEILKIFAAFLITLVIAMPIVQVVRDIHVHLVLFLIISIFVSCIIFVVLLIPMKSSVFKIKL